MFKLRMSVAVLFILGSLICVILAKPLSPRTKCYAAWADCDANCDLLSGAMQNNCKIRCLSGYNACLKKSGISAPPGSAHLPPNVPPTELQPTSSPASSPKRLVRQPQGTLTQASPSPSPNTIFHETKKEKKK